MITAFRQQSEMFNKKFKEEIEFITKFPEAKKNKIIIQKMKDYKHQFEVSQQHIKNLAAIQQDKWTPLPKLCKIVHCTTSPKINYDVKPNVLLLYLKCDQTMRTDGKLYYIIKLGDEDSGKIEIKGDVKREIEASKGIFRKEITIILKEKAVFKDHEKGTCTVKLDILEKQCTYQAELTFGTKQIFKIAVILKVRQAAEPEILNETKDILSVDTYLHSFKGGFKPTNAAEPQNTVSVIAQKSEPSQPVKKVKLPAPVYN